MAVIEEIPADRELSKEEIAKLFEDESQFVVPPPGTEIDAINKFFEDDPEEEEEEDNCVGPTEEEKETIAARFRADVNLEREKYQPTTMERIFAMGKSIILRAMIFYLILWFFKRNTKPGGIPLDEEPSGGPRWDGEFEGVPLNKDEF